ncbi:hypothetical protein G5B31_11730 [Rhodobacter sp. SGA-6-6]|uniref:DUF2298 domain-containing protein n=1 Tax=Rhodobacter sp. SGA-6-6 TaxID=2710882 RepID=UPI0013EDA8E9|nr:DUF2298 domain-containing protein [Rhodobacter sp. SGA-6-6]NGM46204.1 hypothetical protein [Rhodobacter sp. SGA-6-6]
MMGALPAADWAEVLRWLAWLALATVLARPLALRLMPGEGGWIAGKLLGWLVVGWVPWLLASFQILPFGAAAATGLLALALLALRLGLRPFDWRGFLALEAAFAVLFWLGLAVRLNNAGLSGLEKFTDMAFLAAAMRAEAMPPQDAWFAGHPVNYYYVGQAMAAAWAKLAGVGAAHGYQLAMATLFALTALGAGLLTARLAAPWGRRMQAVLGGTAGLLAVYGGNGHSVLYQLVRGWMPTTKDSFYYPDSTRFIGFDPEGPDKAFTEFTSYAYTVGDMHAHVLATPLFLLAAVLVLSILRRGLAGALPGPVQAAGFGWMLGVAFTVNSWDLAILGLMALVALAVLLARPSPLPFRIRADGLGGAAVIALAAAALAAAPFLAGFRPFAEGIAAAPARTPPWQLLVVWGHVLPALLLIPALALARAPAPPLLPITVMAAAGLLLVALPETLYLKDIYGADFARANTMFKLAFRAQTLLVAAGLAVLAPVLARRGGWTLAGLAALAPLVATLAYLPHVQAPLSTIRSLDGLAFLGNERALIEAADRLPLAPGEALVEASSDAFTGGARVSAMTGQPAVIGWTGHEWLWRGAAGPALARAADVDLFYTTADPAARCRIAARYGIRYVILGREERARYPELDEAGLRALGAEVHASAGGSILRIPPGACPG